MIVPRNIHVIFVSGLLFTLEPLAMSFDIVLARDI